MVASRCVILPTKLRPTSFPHGSLKTFGKISLHFHVAFVINPTAPRLEIFDKIFRASYPSVRQPKYNPFLFFRDHLYKGTLESLVLPRLWPSDIVACSVSERFFASVEEKKINPSDLQAVPLWFSLSGNIYEHPWTAGTYMRGDGTVSYETSDKYSSSALASIAWFSISRISLLSNWIFVDSRSQSAIRRPLSRYSRCFVNVSRR